MWARVLVLAVPALGIVALVQGNVVGGLVWLVAIPVASAIGRLIAPSARPDADADEPPAVARSLVRWTIGLGVVGALLIALGISVCLQDLPGIVVGSPSVAMGLFGLYLAGRNAQSMVTVRQLVEIADQHELGTLVVLAGRESGRRGWVRRPVVAGLGDTRLAIARASFGEASWEIRRLTALSKAGVRITGAAGDFEVAGVELDLHLTAVRARALLRAEAILSASRP